MEPVALVATGSCHSPPPERLPLMSSHPENGPDDPEPVQGQVRHSNVSARVPEEIGAGVFSNGVLILTGTFEIVLDFLLRLGEPHRVVSRVVLPIPVARQMVLALQDNLRNYEDRFGPPVMPRFRPPADAPAVGQAPVPREEAHFREAPPSPPVTGPIPGVSEALHPENSPTPTPPSIDDIYGELRIPDSILAGRYANAVLIRHSATEFSFDFLTNIYPRSAVSARVHMAAPNVPGMLQSLIRSIHTPPPQQ